MFLWVNTPDAPVLFDLFGKAVSPEFFGQLRKRLKLPDQGIYSLAVVVWLMMWQRLDGRGSLADAVQQLLQGFLGDLVPPDKRVVEHRVSSNTGALSRARKQLPPEAVEAVCDQRGLRRHRIEQAVTQGGISGGILRGNTVAVKALLSLVRMPQDQHGSRKAIAHWRGSRSTPLDQNPRWANLGSRVRKSWI